MTSRRASACSSPRTRARSSSWASAASPSGMDMLLPDPAALPFLADLKWLGKVRNAARIRFRDERFDLTGCRAKVRALIEEHIAAGGVDQLLPPVSILAPEFEEEIRKLGSDEARASEMEHAIRHEIHVRMDANPVFYQSLRERLAQIIDDRRQARIDAAEQLRLLGTVVQDLKNVHRTAESIRPRRVRLRHLRAAGRRRRARRTARRWPRHGQRQRGRWGPSRAGRADPGRTAGNSPSSTGSTRRTCSAACGRP